MSSVPPSPVPPPPIAVPRSNSLGLAGFIVTILGIFTGGLLLPVGFILSIVAMLKGPRDGVTIAGFVIGLVLSCSGVILVALFGGLVVAIIALASLAPREKLEMVGDMATIAVAVEAYRDEHGVVPPDLSVLALDNDTLLDPWGQDYAYHLTLAPATDGGDATPGFDVVSAGPDGRFGTLDDVELSALGTSWSLDDEQWDVSAESTASGGTSTLRFGDTSIITEGDGRGGRVIIRQGDRVMTIDAQDESQSSGRAPSVSSDDDADGAP